MPFSTEIFKKNSIIGTFKPIVLNKIHTNIILFLPIERKNVKLKIPKANIGVIRVRILKLNISLSVKLTSDKIIPKNVLGDSCKGSQIKNNKRNPQITKTK